MTTSQSLSPEAATELHNRLAKEIIAKLLEEPIAAGGTLSDVMMICESVIVGVMLGCFQLGSDVKMLDIIVDRVKERLAKARLSDIEIKGSG